MLLLLLLCYLLCWIYVLFRSNLSRTICATSSSWSNPCRFNFKLLAKIVVITFVAPGQLLWRSNIQHDLNMFVGWFVTYLSHFQMDISSVLRRLRTRKLFSCLQRINRLYLYSIVPYVVIIVEVKIWLPTEVVLKVIQLY